MKLKLLIALVSLVSAGAGCIDGSDDVAPAVAPIVDDLLAPLTTVVEGSVQLSVTTPVRSFNYGGTFAETLTINETIQGVVVELVWDAATPASESLSMWIREAGVGTLPPADPTQLLMPVEPIAAVSGEGPLRLALPATDLPAGEYEILVRAASDPAGVALEQAFTMHVTTFDGVPFDASFTALAEGGAGAGA